MCRDSKHVPSPCEAIRSSSMSCDEQWPKGQVSFAAQQDARAAWQPCLLHQTLRMRRASCPVPVTNYTEISGNMMDLIQYEAKSWALVVAPGVVDNWWQLWCRISYVRHELQIDLHWISSPGSLCSRHYRLAVFQRSQCGATASLICRLVLLASCRGCLKARHRYT
jgi:hypothetical protein